MVKSISIALIALSLTAFPGCKTLESFFGGVPSTTQVTTDTALVVNATRTAVLLAGPSAESTLNAYILLVHNSLSVLASGIQAGTAILWTPAQVQAALTNLATQFGNPVWMTNMIGNLTTEYTRFYNAISKDSATTYAYLEAFAAGTV